MMTNNKMAYAKCAYRDKYDEALIYVQFCQYKKSVNSTYVVHLKYNENTFCDDFDHLDIFPQDIVNKYVNDKNEISYHELNIDIYKIYGEYLYLNRIESVDFNKVSDENRKKIRTWNLKKGKDNQPATYNKKLVYYKIEFDNEDRDVLLPCDNEVAVDIYPKPESVDQLMQLIKSSKNLELNGWELEGQYLNWANLTGADLQNANLSNTHLYRANLNRACLWEAKLIGANLVMADLVGAELAYADLSGADLSGAFLFGSDLSNVNLSNARLCNANLSNAKMENTNLQNADLRGANLSGIKIRNSNFKGAKLKKVNLIGANISESDLSAVNFFHANLTGASLESCNLTNASVEGTIVKSTSLRGSNIEMIRNSNGNMETAFRESNLTSF